MAVSFLFTFVVDHCNAANGFLGFLVYVTWRKGVCREIFVISPADIICTLSSNEGQTDFKLDLILLEV